MPTKKKEVKAEEPLFVDEAGRYVHEVEGARYKGGIRRYACPAGADATAASPAKSSRSKSASSPGKGGGTSPQSTVSTAAVSDAPVFRHGRGVYTCPSFTYTGDWVEDEMHGSGQLAFTESGNVYEGEFFHGCFSGQGTYHWRNGAMYCGEWRANRMHGEGVYTDAQGHVWKGRYYNGTGPGLIRLYPTLERVDGAGPSSPAPTAMSAATASAIS
ncbi:putative MORN repeat [Leishmania utingensis]|uniref:MORN repeat n=1 Tax=Leishmania utingensis TaxID=653362 RepID=A0AAW3AW76_9TRYP